MGILNRMRGRNDEHLAAAASNNGTFTHDAKEHDLTDDSASDLSIPAQNEKEVQAHPDTVTQGAAPGVQKAEAAALVWSKKAVWLTYGWIWVGFFMLAFQSSIGLTAGYVANSAFATAPQISTALILSAIIGGVLKLPIAKILNVWGRAEGLIVSLVVLLIGIIILASSDGPNSYAAGYTLYWIGYDALYLILDVFVADTSGLRNRAFAWGFASTPFIATAFVGPLAAQSIIGMAGWRWCYGIFAIVMPFVFLPLAVVFKFYQRKAIKLGVYQKNASGRTTVQSFVHYFHEFDLIGALILMAAFIFFLLPFSLATYFRTTYHSATFIVLVVIGILLFPTFYVWERYFTRTHFIRWELFRSRTVLGACTLAATVYFSFYCWDIYFYYFCLVVYNLSLADAGYMVQIYNVGSCFWSVVFGLWIRYTKHFKWTCFFFGLPLMILGAGLLTHFRSAKHGIGYVVMAQIFIAFGGGTLIIGENMAVMAAADRDGVPLMLSLLQLSANLGGAIGLAVSSAIYNAKFPAALTATLPEAQKFNATAINQGGYQAQLLYPVGSPTRNAIDYAWGESQKWEAVAATVILVLGIPAIFVWKNYRVDKQQNKGTVI